VKSLASQIKTNEAERQQIENEMAQLAAKLTELQSQLDQSKAQWQKLIDERIVTERSKARDETSISLRTEVLDEMRQLVESSSRQMNTCIHVVERLEATAATHRNPNDYLDMVTNVKSAYQSLEETWTQQLQRQSENLKAQMEIHHDALQKATKHLLETQLKTQHTAREINDLTDQIITAKIDNALLGYRGQNIERQLQKLQRDLRIRTAEYEEAAKKAGQTGSRIASTRDSSAILDEIRLTDGHLIALGDVSEDIERMYESYSKLYLDLKEKAQTVAESREKTLEEVDARLDAWRTVIQHLLDTVNLQYQRILNHAQAAGQVRLANGHDIEAAGLEVLVGFKGAPLVPLDAYTQSGGERSMATMSFLLALQQHVTSPFRAVDEYDVHMDPKNRETITSLLIESVEGGNSQYLIITPTQITFAKPDLHIITVQNVEGSSRVREAV
jgi:chromosome segregation ATPase